MKKWKFDNVSKKCQDKSHFLLKESWKKIDFEKNPYDIDYIVSLVCWISFEIQEIRHLQSFYQITAVKCHGKDQYSQISSNFESLLRFFRL